MDSDRLQRSGLPYSRLLRLNDICDRFEEVARTGAIPRIEDYLESVPETERSFLLGELLAQELELRVERGECPVPEEYQARFPLHSEIIAGAFGCLVAGPTASDTTVSPGSGTTEFEDRHPERDLMGPTPELPGYRVLEEIGRGGMGVVYRAIQIALSRNVALKMIRAGDSAGRDDLLRFQREAETVARMQHPNIVQIFDVGWHAGLPYFSMEFVEGGNLKDQFDGTPMKPRDAVVLVRTLACAIQAAHERGVIHRDLKPANILLTAQGVPKIADFGLAVQLDAKECLTASSAIVGTPSYMAPEQASGKAGSIGSAVDVYALGAILYELVTGRPPFMAATPVETVLLARDTEPVAPRKLAPRLPRDVETIILACIRKQPAQRCKSARALADDLDRWLDGKPIWTRRVGLFERSILWVRRHPAVAGLILMTACAVALAIGGNTLRHRAIESAAMKDAETARAEAILHAERLAMARREFEGGHVRRANEYLDECAPSLRNWEWFYYKRRFRTERFSVLTWGPAFAFSPNGSYIATWGLLPGRPNHDGIVQVWDAASGKEIRKYEGPQGIYYAAFSPDGTRLVAAAGKSQRAYSETRFWGPWGGVTLAGEVVVWDTASDQKLLDIHQDELERGSAGSVSLSPDGRWIASARSDGVVTTWDATSGREVWSSRRHLEGVTSLAFSPDGARLASANSEAEWVTIRDSATENEHGSMHRHLAGAAELKFSPDGRFLIARDQARGVEGWDTANAREVLYFQKPSAYVALSTDSRQLIIANADGAIAATSLDGASPGPEPWKLAGVRGTVTYLAQGPGSKHLVSVADMNSTNAYPSLSCWDIEAKQERLTLKLPPRDFSDLSLRVNHFSVSRDGKRLASALGPLTVWDTATGQAVWGLGSDSPASIGVALGPDGRRIAAMSSDGHLTVRDVTTDIDVPLQSLGPFRSACAEIDPEGDKVAAIDDTGTLWSGDTSSGQPLARVKRQIPNASFAHICPAVSPDVRSIAVVTGDGSTASVHDLQSWRVLDRLPSREGSFIGSLAFSPDGKRLATGYWDGSIALWESPQPRPVVSVKDDTAFVTRLIFSGDGRRLLSATEDGELNVRDLDRLRPVGPSWAPFGHTKHARQGRLAQLDCLALSPDGMKVAAVGARVGPEGRVLEVWDAETGRVNYSLPVGEVSAIAFAPDGTRLATAGPEVRLLDAKSGNLVCLLSSIQTRALKLTFAQQGHRLVALCEDGVKIWDARPLDGP
jgi:eukaryotic-like serine/threonine-protein kinase